MEFSKIILIVSLSVFVFELASAQYSAGDEEDDEYDEELVESEAKGETKKPSTSASVTKTASKVSPTKAASSGGAVTAAASSSGSSASSSGSVQSVTTRRPRSTTSDDFDEDDEETTEHPAMNPLSKLFESVSIGNVTGIVDHALSIRAPAPVRQMVNTIMSGIFNIGGLISNTVANTFGGATTQSPLKTPTMSALTQQQLLQAQLYQQQLIAQAYQQQLIQQQQAHANLLARQPVDPVVAKYGANIKGVLSQGQLKSDSDKVKSKVKVYPPKIKIEALPEVSTVVHTTIYFIREDVRMSTRTRRTMTSQ